jgi:hypothetical protein
VAALSFPIAVSAKPHPSYVLVESKWDEIKAAHPDDPAFILKYDVEYEVLTAAYSWPVTNGRTSVTMAVLDMERAGNSLDRAFSLPPGTKLKGVWAWSHELGGSAVTWAESKDIHTLTVFGNWKEIRVAIPGLSKAGVCGVEIETQSDGLPYVSENFMGGLPMDAGEVRLVFPRIDEFGFDKTVAMVDRIYTTIVEGPVEEIPPAFTDKGYCRTFRVKNLAARPKAAMAAAADFPRADALMVPSWFKWKGWVEHYDTALAEAVPPKSLVKAARDTLSSAAPLDVVLAVARYLDDPKNFRLLGPYRSGAFSIPDIDEIVKKKEGDTFDKAVLAHLLLKGLKVESHLVFAASKYRTVPDGRIADPRRLDAVLLSVPSISKGFLWDVADRSVPVGEAGPDLYSLMVVCDPEAAAFDRQFQVCATSRCEQRTTTLVLDENGALRGTLSCRFVGWPMIDELDPWKPGQDVTALIQAKCPSGAKADSAVWMGMDRVSMRCTAESPAILSCRLITEATPNGERGWEIKPFLWALPEPLARIDLADRSLPVFLDRRIEVAESTLVRLDGVNVKQIPPTVRLDNRAGLFECSWAQAPDAVIATRRLQLPAQHAADTKLEDLVALCKAWQESRSSAVIVE